MTTSILDVVKIARLVFEAAREAGAASPLLDRCLDLYEAVEDVGLADPGHRGGGGGDPRRLRLAFPRGRRSRSIPDSALSGGASRGSVSA